jgi:hypothetical protein
MSKAHLLRQEQQKREQCMEDRLASYHNIQMLLFFRRCRFNLPAWPGRLHEDARIY